MAAARTFRPWLFGAVAGLALVVATLPLPWHDPDFDLDPLVRVAMAVSGAAQLVMVDRARDRTSVTTATGVLGATTLAYPLILGLSAADVGAPLTTALSTFWHTIPLTLLQVVPLLASGRVGARPLRGWLRAVVAIAIVGFLLTGWFVLGGPGAGVVGPLSTLLWFGSFLLAPIATWRNIRGTAGEMRRRAIVAALAALLPIAVVGWCVALGVIGTEAGWSDDFSVGALMVGFALGTATCSLLALGAVSQPASRMVRTRVVVVALNIVLATIVGIAACTGTLLAARAGLPAGGMFAIGALAAIAVGAPWVRLHRWIVRVVDPAAELRHEVSALGRIDDGAQRQSVLLVLRRVTDDPDLMLTYDPPPDGGAPDPLDVTLARGQGGRPAVTAHAGSAAAAVRLTRLGDCTGLLGAALLEHRVAIAHRQAEQAAESERRRLAQNLHDGLQGQLLGLALNLQMSARALPDPNARLLAEDTVDALREMVDEVRSLGSGRLPAALADHGLTAALGPLLQTSGARIALDLPPTRLGPTTEATAYFVISEAVTNALKHAGAARIDVQVSTPSSDRVQISVSDDGAGGADPRLGAGLRGLSERVTAAGGTFLVRDGAPSGTVVEAVLPCGS